MASYNEDKSMWRFLTATFSVCGLIVVLSAAGVADGCLGKDVSKEAATVLAVAYTPGRYSTGTGTGVGANGQTVMVNTSTYETEKWGVVVRLADGRVVGSVCRTGEAWGQLTVGGPATLTRWSGPIGLCTGHYVTPHHE